MKIQSALQYKVNTVQHVMSQALLITKFYICQVKCTGIYHALLLLLYRILLIFNQQPKLGCPRCLQLVQQKPKIFNESTFTYLHLNISENLVGLNLLLNHLLSNYSPVQLRIKRSGRVPKRRKKKTNNLAKITMHFVTWG